MFVKVLVFPFLASVPLVLDINFLIFAKVFKVFLGVGRKSINIILF